MPYQTITDGLTITIPTNGTTNYGDSLQTGAWEPISAHDHSGGGKGTQISFSSISIPTNSIARDKLAITLPGVIATDQTVSGAAVTVDFSLGTEHYIDGTGMTGNFTFTFNNPVEGAFYRISFHSPAINITANFPANWKNAANNNKYVGLIPNNKIYVFQMRYLKGNFYNEQVYYYYP